MDKFVDNLINSDLFSNKLIKIDIFIDGLKALQSIVIKKLYEIEKETIKCFVDINFYKINDLNKKFYDKIQKTIKNLIDQLSFKELDEILSLPEKVVTDLVDPKIKYYIQTFFDYVKNKELISDIVKQMKTYENDDYSQLNHLIESEDFKKSLKNFNEELIYTKIKLYNMVYENLDEKNPIIEQAYEDLILINKAIESLNNQIQLSDEDVEKFYNILGKKFTEIDKYLDKNDFQDSKTLYRPFNYDENFLINILTYSTNQNIIKNQLIELLKAAKIGDKSQLNKENYENQIDKLKISMSQSEINMLLSYSKQWRINRINMFLSKI